MASKWEKVYSSHYEILSSQIKDTTDYLFRRENLLKNFESPDQVTETFLVGIQPSEGCKKLWNAFCDKHEKVIMNKIKLPRKPNVFDSSKLASAAPPPASRQKFEFNRPGTTRTKRGRVSEGLTSYPEVKKQLQKTPTKEERDDAASGHNSQPTDPELNMVLSLLDAGESGLAKQELQKLITKAKASDKDEDFGKVIKYSFYAGLLYEQQEQFQEAYTCYSEAYDNLQQVKTPNAPFTAIVLRRKLCMEWRQGKKTMALSSLLKLRKEFGNEEASNNVDRQINKTIQNIATDAIRQMCTNHLVNAEPFNIDREEVMDFLLSFDGDPFSVYLHQILTEDNWLGDKEDFVEFCGLFEEEPELATATGEGQQKERIYIPNISNVHSQQVEPIVILMNTDNALKDKTLVELIGVIIHGLAETLTQQQQQQNQQREDTADWISTAIYQLQDSIDCMKEKTNMYPERILSKLIIATLFMALGYLHLAEVNLQSAEDDIISFMEEEPTCEFIKIMQRSILVRFGVLFYLEGRTCDAVWLLTRIMKKHKESEASECLNFLAKILLAYGHERDLLNLCREEIHRASIKTKAVGSAKMTLAALVICSGSRVLNDDVQCLTELGIKSSEPKNRKKIKVRQLFELKAQIKTKLQDVNQALALEEDASCTGNTKMQTAWKVSALMTSSKKDKLLKTDLGATMMKQVTDLSDLSPNEGVSLDRVIAWMLIQRFHKRNEDGYRAMCTALENVNLNTFLSVMFGVREMLRVVIKADANDSSATWNSEDEDDEPEQNIELTC